MTDAIPGPRWSGPFIVSDKTFVLKVGIFFTSLALLTGGWLLYHIGAFPPLVALLALVAYGLAVFVYRLRAAPYVLRLDDKGLDDRTQSFGGGGLGWDELRHARVVEADGRAMIGLTLAEEARARRGFLTQARMERQRKDLGCEVILPPEAFGDDAPEVYAAALQRLIDLPEERRALAQ